ncbi:MAG: hypothetical protein ABI988_15455 [Nitrospirota bacterium]
MNRELNQINVIPLVDVMLVLLVSYDESEEKDLETVASVSRRL